MTEKQERYMNPTALCPLVPLDDFVIFPEMTVIFDVGEELAVKAVEAAFYGDRFILASLRIGEPSPGESPSLHTAGTLCEITHLVEQQKNSLRISVKGL
ncbi:MAG: LON peptidase substrate-binding domain-containing protein, partial [bacterium]